MWKAMATKAASTASNVSGVWFHCFIPKSDRIGKEHLENIFCWNASVYESNSLYLNHVLSLSFLLVDLFFSGLLTTDICSLRGKVPTPCGDMGEKWDSKNPCLRM